MMPAIPAPTLPLMNIAQLLDRAARSTPDRLAVGHGDAPFASNLELARRTARLARHCLETLGLKTGDRVGIFTSNRPEYVEILLAIWWAGLCAVPINAKLHPKELAYILQNSGARCCFTSPASAEGVAAVLGVAPTIDVSSARYREMLGHGAPMAMRPAASDDPAWLFYTSGTTGRPKGVTITHHNLLAASLAYFSDVDSIGPNDCVVHAAPMSHGSGLYILPHLMAGVAQIIPISGAFEPDEIFDIAATRGGVAMFAAPTMVKRLVDHAKRAHPKLDGIKTIIYGGGPMYLADIQDALATMGQRFAQIYGQGETPMTITALSKFHLGNTSHPRYLERIVSVGVRYASVEVLVVDEEDEPLPAGRIGEIIVRGDPVMKGYWENPEATATTLRNGWLHTGDLGVFDEDGFLTLKDRSKDLIISGGSNIYPREVEEALLLHPGVHEVSVVGRIHSEWGEEVIAFVVVEPGATVTRDALDQTCLDNIARFKRPKSYRFVDALPKNNYGKVLKTELREQLEHLPDATRVQ